jgi:hypothetical protein
LIQIGNAALFSVWLARINSAPFVNGAPDLLLERCTRIYREDGVRELGLKTEHPWQEQTMPWPRADCACSDRLTAISRG